jgi:hypothetical protein
MRPYIWVKRMADHTTLRVRDGIMVWRGGMTMIKDEWQGSASDLSAGGGDEEDIGRDVVIHLADSDEEDDPEVEIVEPEPEPEPELEPESELEIEPPSPQYFTPGPEEHRSPPFSTSSSQMTPGSGRRCCAQWLARMEGSARSRLRRWSHGGYSCIRSMKG